MRYAVRQIFKPEFPFLRQVSCLLLSGIVITFCGVSGTSAEEVPSPRPEVVFWNFADGTDPCLIDSEVSLDKWYYRATAGFMEYGNGGVLHPPPYIPDQDLVLDLQLSGIYDIYVGMRQVNYPTSVQIGLDPMDLYYLVKVPGAPQHRNVEVPVASGIDMTGRSIRLRPTGQSAYIGHLRFVPREPEDCFEINVVQQDTK